MSPEQIVTVVTGILQGGGIAVFIWFLIRGLRAKIATLESTVKLQHETLAVMEKRITETEKVGRIYKDLLDGLPQDLDNYKAVISKTKDEVILELQNSNKQKEQRIRAIEERAQQQPQSPASSAPHLAAMRFLLEAQNESFRKFVIEMCGDIDVAVDALVRAADFDSLLQAERKRLVIEDDKEKWEALVKPKNREANGMRSANWSMNGWHAFFDDGRLVMSSNHRNSFSSSYRTLKVKLAALAK